MVLLAVTISAVILISVYGPVRQDMKYHQFADQRRIYGIPNFWNTVSNLSFFVSGFAGLSVFLHGKTPGALPQLRIAYISFFIGTIWIALGSAYYHLSPDNRTLFWDRLPMAVSFMAFLSIVIGEHIDPGLGIRLLAPLVLVGILSVFYWNLSGDLRFYILIQYLPMMLIPLILLLFPSFFHRIWYIWGFLVVYGTAKFLDLLDEQVFKALKIVSGHTLKHIAAGLGLSIFAAALIRRREKGKAIERNPICRLIG